MKHTCPKCKGFVVPDSFVAECRWFAELRCINCGWIKLLMDRPALPKREGYEPVLLSLGQL